MIWAVKETPCYPASWKVYPTRKYREVNDTYLYHRSRKAAQEMADRLNKHDPQDTVTLQCVACGWY
jgi:hypothetical protein